VEETLKGYRKETGSCQRKEEPKEEELGRDEGIQKNIQQCGFKIVRKQTLSR
jgi:hypothetical protein